MRIKTKGISQLWKEGSKKLICLLKLRVSGDQSTKAEHRNTGRQPVRTSQVAKLHWTASVEIAENLSIIQQVYQ
jgi:hypothetical protein